MTTPDHESPAPQPPASEFKDRIYRSSSGIAGGVLLLAIAAWLGIDAIISGHGRTPWLALAAMILIVPLIVAFTLRPAVYANNERLRIRNPFRVVVVPWGQVATLRSGYSNEVVTNSGGKYQLWSVPVSLRARKKAARREARSTAERAAEANGRGGRGGLGGRGRMGALGGSFGPGGFSGGAAAGREGATRAQSDQVMDDLRELLETHERAETAQGEVTVRWAYEIAGPVLAGIVLLAVLVATG
ncbi:MULTISPECIES: PH domain-containing protein [unclassified Streptomyces]|uniref:PH domain-containing protein n=1 Tax=unclassified Streptomyces TaxID=2593676 RepID=UPI0022562625|nr:MULTISPECIES: PH domain-containing protein [unclassified Streptomyces]MCX5050642.1 PH domain-containing protein [Streptomyces sp. NBC_00474]MCX5061019.1 PH domain-containing protein [Streptomyces sp. NBC_00452]MCX5248549.1 PH domain-containing protein [Streptomyces sp. NBC_00201]MCX5293356.1 PH domain-containing protein [Streptomyces sp. NBC_00183]